jgi:Fur family zinc uptake transcriptional regulator
MISGASAAIAARRSQTRLMSQSDAADISERLARAEASCALRGAKLTDIRRTVLELILQAGEPIGAYALLDRLKDKSGQGKPPTVYRALDFLLAQGLIHRVERLNAFVSCHEEADHPHPVQFLICSACGTVAEYEDAAIGEAVAQVAARTGFVVKRSIVEAEGLCCDCAAQTQQKKAVLF